VVVAAKEPLHGGGGYERTSRGGGGRRSKIAERERDEREVGRMAREGERHCEGGRQCTREEEEAL